MGIDEDFQQLRRKYDLLFPLSNESGWELKGTLAFEFREIQDHYEVSINIPQCYPRKIPTVKEVGGRIAREFHTNPDLTLCLGTNYSTWAIFSKEKTLLNFVEKLLVPYLYSHSVFKSSGKMPFGEREHGAMGILNDYRDKFGVSNDVSTIRLLKTLSSGHANKNEMCPCGSGKKIARCHRDILISMKATGYDRFLDDFNEVKTITRPNIGQARYQNNKTSWTPRTTFC